MFTLNNTIKTKEDARSLAIQWQNWVSEQNLSYGEIFEYENFSSKIISNDIDENNNGYIHGLYWFDEHNNIIDCQWFKTTKERTQFKKDFDK